MNEIQYQILKQAYEKMRQFIGENECVRLDADNVWSDFQNRISIWGEDRNQPDFIMDYLSGTGMNNIASVGLGIAYLRNFQIFMQSPDVREVVTKLLNLRLNLRDNCIQEDWQTAKQAADYISNRANLVSMVNRFTFPSGRRPIALTTRFQNIIFDNLCTTIAKDDDLRFVCQRLRESTSGSVLNKQITVRKLSDEFLIRDNLFSKSTRWEKAALAYWV